MSIGLYLTIGLNSVDAGAYGDVPNLRACENDAKDMAAIAAKAGFTGKTLLTTEATSVAVLSELYAAAKKLESGDMLVLAYSGHGAQIGDVNGDESDDRLDETWCLHDRMLIDDELYAMWAQFKPGVRIFVLSDSCHSGTVLKDFELKLMLDQGYFIPVVGAGQENAVSKVAAQGEAKTEGKTQISQPAGRFKAIDFDKAWHMYVANKSMYDSLQYIAGPSEKTVIGASIILISGCQDNQLSQDGEKNGMFTYALKTIWADGKYSKNYESFQIDIQGKLPTSQSPKYFKVGAVNLAFEAQQPFML